MKPLHSVPPLAIAFVIVALVVVVTEFASNVATASGLIPIVGALVAGSGVDPMLIALPAAMAASWGFMLPSGTGPNAIAWASGHIALPKMLKAGLMLDYVGRAADGRRRLDRCGNRSPSRAVEIGPREG